LHDIFDSTCTPLVLEKSKVASLSFADDLVILSNTSEGLQNSLNKLEKYCYDWQLTVNTKKTKVMIFQNTQSPSPNFYYKNVLLTETKEYNFLGNVIDFKGSFKKATQELSKKGLKVLFSLKNRFMNFSSIPINLSCKLFDIPIRPILTYNSEIWLMDDYFSISRARSEQSGSVCDTLSLEDKFCYEKIHNKFCKYILGLKKIACNNSAKSELGRFPITDYIKTQAILYFCRLQTDLINPLCKSVDSDGIYTWYSFIRNIFKELDLEITEFENFTRLFASIKHSLN
jgi:hypothetical protein